MAKKWITKLAGTKWVKKKKHNLAIWCLQETHFNSKGTGRLKVEEKNKVLCANGIPKKTGVAILLADTTYLKSVDKQAIKLRIQISDTGMKNKT